MTAQDYSAVLAWVRLLNAHAAMTRAFNADLLASHGMTVTDFQVLRELADAPERQMRRVDLAERVGLTPSGITRLLDGLQAGGLVAKESCATDARVTYARLTDEGAAALARASATHVAQIAEVMGERYGAEELEALVELLGRLPGATAPATCLGEDAVSPAAEAGTPG